MTKLADLLRSAADRAPVGEVSVSTTTARRRIRVQRGARGVANGLTGAGAVALIVLGVMNPVLASAKNGTNDLAAPESAGANPGGDRTASDDMGLSYGAWWGECASYPLDSSGSGTIETVVVDIDSDGWVDIEAGSSIDVPVTVTATSDSVLDTTGPEGVVLYQGMVVAYFGSTEAFHTLTLATGESSALTLSLPLVNCFDGSALPAGEYQVLVSQGFALTSDGTPTEPGPGPGPTPSTAPAVSPDPGLSPEPTPVTENLGTVAAPEAVPAGDPAVDGMPVWEGSTRDDRVAAKPVPLMIAGDPVEDPFGQYLYVWEPPAMPDNVLTPDQARLLFAVGLDSEPWNMSPGTSRWITPDYSGPAVMTDDMRFAAGSSAGWFGCSYDGVTGVDFPSQSAQLDLLDVSASVPSRAHVSYGWVVDGNPLVTYSVSNTSDYSIPGFYGQPNTQLYLVKDGRVVATAYPVNTDPTGGMVYPASVTKDAVAPGDALDVVAPVQEDPATYWGLLSPGATVGGQYLWRDISGCWNESGQTAIDAGTYTVLSMQSLYLQSTVPMSGSGNTGVVPPTAPPETLDGSREDASTSMLVDPYYPTYDYLELQMWTSLGTVTITTN